MTIVLDGRAGCRGFGSLTRRVGRTGVAGRPRRGGSGAPSEVIGLDVNTGMLRVARSILSSDNTTITYREGSAMALPFPEAAFDVVLCQHGLEFFPDRSQCVREMGRVLRSERRLGLRVWRALEHQVFHPAVLAALDRYLWRGQDVPSRPGFAQPFSVWNAEELRALVLDAGFRDIEVRVSTIPIRLETNPTAICGYLSALPIGNELANIDETARHILLHEAMTDLQPFIEAEAFVIPAESHVVLARR